MNINITSQTSVKDLEKIIAVEMDKAIKHFEKDILTIRTGRANSTIVEDLKVNCYGNSLMKLKEVAAITIPDARLIVIQPWDKSVLGDIEKAITTSDLGLSPVNTGELIRIQLPMMSAERRDELVKTLHKKLEDCRTGVRNVRKDIQNIIRDAEKKRVVSEDFAKALLDCLQKETDKFIAQAEKISSKKEVDIKS